MATTSPRSRIRISLWVATAVAALIGTGLVAPAAHAGDQQDSALSTALDQAASTGFLTEFHGADQVFNGQRTVPVSATGISRLKASQQGTLVVRYLTESTTNQVVIAGGSGTSADTYGALLANGSSAPSSARVDFPNGMVANIGGGEVVGNWRTIAYSVNATPGGTTGRTVTSVDGSTTTPFPNFASWFNANPQINTLSYLTIGGAPGALAKSNNSTNFVGRIAFVAFIPKAYTQQEAANITAGVYSGAQVFSRGDATRSDFFRIPFLLNTSAGSLIAGTDANFGSTGDSAENIDAALRRKPQATSSKPSAGWQAPTVPSALHMRDYADESGYKQKSASVIDGAIVQDTVGGNGRIHVLIDLFAWNGGVFEFLNINSEGQAAGGRARSFALGDGFATIGGRKYLLLSTSNVKGSADGQTNNINRNTDRSLFNRVADVNGPRDASGRIRVFALNGTPQPYSSTGTPVSDANLSVGAATDYTLDDEFVLYKAGVQQTVAQKSSAGAGAQVPLKVFYEDSPLQVYNTSYILQVYSDDDGQTWKSGQLVSGQVKREDSGLYILGPGAAIQLKNGPHAGRLVVPVYYQQGSQKTEMIYSDDHGVTWKHGSPVPSNGYEATLVELPGGALQVFIRNAGGGGKVLTATSSDGGVTWYGVRSALGDTAGGVNSQVSAINLAAPMVSPTTGQSLPAIVMTTAMQSSRVNGVAHIGLIHTGTPDAQGRPQFTIEWVSQYPITGSKEQFAYSSMVQLANGDVGILYEASRTGKWSDGLQAMYYRQISVADLRG